MCHGVKKTYKVKFTWCHDGGFGQGETYINRKLHTGAMAAGGVRQPAVIQGGNLPWHDCVLNIHWFMISKGDGAIDDRVTYEL